MLSTKHTTKHDLEGDATVGLGPSTTPPVSRFFFKALPISNEKFSGPQNTLHFSLPSAAKPGRFDITTLMTAFGLTH